MGQLNLFKKYMATTAYVIVTRMIGLIASIAGAACIFFILRASIQFNAPRLYLGAHLGMAEVGHALATKLVARPVDQTQPIEIEVDGEILGHLPATFQILPKALRVRCPRTTV